MKKNIIHFLLLLILSTPYAAFSDTEEEANDTTDEVVETSEEAETTSLESGHGWKNVAVAELGKSGKKVHMILVEHERYTDKTVYSNAISRICQGETEFCRVRFWSEARYIPERAKLTADQRKQLRADYLFNKAAGIKELRWSCTVDPNSVNCM